MTVKSMADLFAEEEATALEQHRQREAALTPEQLKARADRAAQGLADFQAALDAAPEEADPEDDDETEDDPA